MDWFGLAWFGGARQGRNGEAAHGWEWHGKARPERRCKARRAEDWCGRNGKAEHGPEWQGRRG